MSQIPSRKQTEIFQRKPYLQNYFQSQNISQPKLNILLAKAKASVMRHNPTSHDTEPPSSIEPLPKDKKSSHYVSLDKSKSPPEFNPKERQQYYVSLNGKPLASSYDPQKQAERIFYAKQAKDRDLIIILGLGNPELVRLCNENAEPNQVILAIDSSEEMVPLLWNTYLEDFADIPGRHIFAGERFIPLLWNYMDGLPIERMSGIKIYTNQANLQLEPEFYLGIEERLSTAFSTKMSDLLTKFEFETIWISNIIKNTIAYHRSNNQYKISELQDLLENTPAVLVSAGPSLRNHVEYLKIIRDKVFILSCDTSLKVLLSSGITPDAVYTLDAQMNSLFHFLGEDLKNIPMFADLVTAPYLINTIEPKSIVYSLTAKFIHDVSGQMKREVTAGGEFADEYIGRIGDIQSGGSVATTAFDALRFMGCTEIFFIGQDLAYTGREIHSTGTHHNEKWLGLVNRRTSLEKINEAVVRKRDTRYVESISGGQVLTDYVLDLYRSWFEECSQSLDGFTLTNLGEHGAKINGMNNINPEKVVQDLADRNDHDYHWKSHPVWTAVPINHDIALKDPVEIAWEDITNCLDSIQEWKYNENYLSLMDEWFSKRLYLKRIFRKTEVYVARHRDQLNEDRKKKLIFQSIEKEMRKLKRKIYPMLGDDLFTGNSKSSS
jgi:hypothetical protein